MEICVSDLCLFALIPSWFNYLLFKSCSVPGSTTLFTLSLSPLLSLLVKKFSSIFEVGVAGLLKVGLIFFQCLEFLCLKMLFLVYFYSYNYKSYFLSLIFYSRAIVYWKWEKHAKIGANGQRTSIGPISKQFTSLSISSVIMIASL